MNISHNKVVSFHYSLSDDQGQMLETSRTGDPTLFLVGANNVLPGLEQALLGKEVGDKVEGTLEPHLAYGVRNENKTDRISAKYLKHEDKLTPGKIVRINTDKGMRTATIIKIGKFSVDIDLNHPLAGKTITFDVEIVDIREATAEEIAHRHAHGIGGHQH